MVYFIVGKRSLITGAYVAYFSSVKTQLKSSSIVLSEKMLVALEVVAKPMNLLVRVLVNRVVFLYILRPAVIARRSALPSA